MDTPLDLMPIMYAHDRPMKLEIANSPESQTINRLVEQEVLPPVPDIDYAFRGALSDYVRRFNMYAEILGDTARSTRPFDVGHMVHRARREVEDAVHALEEKVLQFVSHCDEFAIAVQLAAQPQWYRKVKDLTAYTQTDLEKALLDPTKPRRQLTYNEDGVPIGSVLALPTLNSPPVGTVSKVPALDIESTEDFAAYLRETLPSIWLREERPPGETRVDFKTKVDCIFDRLGANDEWHIALRMWGWAKYHFGAPDSGMHLISAAADWKMVHCAFLGESSGKIDYWDHAWTYRYLLLDYQRCDTRAGRRSKEDQLESWFTKARGEIRKRTTLAMCTSQVHIPPELVDRCIEWAMVAEGLSPHGAIPVCDRW